MSVCRGNWGILDSYLDAVPVLAGEGVDGLLLETLLALGQSLVPVKIYPSADCSFRFRRHCVRFWQSCIVAGTGEIDVLANSHLCEVRISKTGNGSLGGWNWEIARFGILGGDRRQIDKANFLGGAGLVARAPRKKEGPISGERALSEYVSIPNMHLSLECLPPIDFDANRNEPHAPHGTPAQPNCPKACTESLGCSNNSSTGMPNGS